MDDKERKLIYEYMKNNNDVLVVLADDMGMTFNALHKAIDIIRRQRDIEAEFKPQSPAET